MQDTTEAKIDGGFARLVQLFERASPMTASHWNVRTGEVFHLRNSRRARGALEAFEERLFDEEGWHEVAFQESDAAFAMASEFADDLKPGRGRAELLAALAGDKPFRGFRGVLKRRPGLARRYRAVQLDEATWRAVEFCLAHDLRLDDPKFDEVAARLRAQWQKDAEADGVVSIGSLSLGRK